MPSWAAGDRSRCCAEVVETGEISPSDHDWRLAHRPRRDGVAGAVLVAGIAETVAHANDGSAAHGHAAHLASRARRAVDRRGVSPHRVRELRTDLGRDRQEAARRRRVRDESSEVGQEDHRQGRDQKDPRAVIRLVQRRDQGARRRGSRQEGQRLRPRDDRARRSDHPDRSEDRYFKGACSTHPFLSDKPDTSTAGPPGLP